MVRLVPMMVEEFEAYLDKAIPEYAEENIRAGYWAEGGAMERSRKIYLNFLPDGVKTENNYLFNIQVEESGEKIGVLWIKHEVPRPHGFIFDIRLDEAHRGKGYGKEAMLALENVAKELGLKTIGLHVFAHNTVAMSLYKRLGYEISSQNMVKRLED